MKITKKWNSPTTTLMVAFSFGLSLSLIPALPFGHSGTADAAVPVLHLPIPATPATPAAPSDVPQAIPLTDVAEQAELALAQVRRLGDQGGVDDLIDSITAELPALERDSALRTRETQQVLTKNPTLQAIRNLEDEWNNIGQRADAATRELTRNASRLDGALKELEKLAASWDATQQAATNDSAPATVLTRVSEVDTNVAAARKQMLNKRTKVLDLQGKSTDIGARTTEMQQLLTNARERAAARLLRRDSQPLWSRAFWSAWNTSFSGEAKNDLASQGVDVRAYVQTQAWRFALHALFFFGLAALLLVAQARIRSLRATDTSLRRAGEVFDLPFVSAMLIGILVSTWFYPGAPRTMWIIISVLGAAPVLFFIRCIIDRSFYPALYAAVGFYLADRVRDVFAPFPNLSRLLLLLETLLVILFCVWMLHRSAHSSALQRHTQVITWRVLRVAHRLILWLFVAALAANSGGYVHLADLLVRTVLGSAYTAVVLYALMRVAEGILQGLMYVVPISMLGMVRLHKNLLISHIGRWLRWIAVLSWLGLTMQGTGLLQALGSATQTVWKASVAIGSFTLTVGNVLLFFFILWAAYMLSRVTRFILEEEVFPKVRLERGLPYAITTMLHYVLLFSGFVLALGAIGVDMTRFTILISAFSVGIGFGLQNVVNNFVSGLIVLFERPIKVGDIVQIGDMTGSVQRIGIRASVILSTQGSEVIVPNGKLISDNVINWTLSNQLRQIAVPLTTKSDVQVADLKQLLLGIADHNPQVAKTPGPEVLFIKHGLDAFEFELRIWTAELTGWLQIKSDLITEIDQALRQRQMALQAQTSATPPPP